jgi:hypothetical protein
MVFYDGKPLVVVSVELAPPPAVLSDFASLIKYEAGVDQELRSEEVVDARYHGRALDGSATSAALWEIVKFDRDGDKEIVRTRYLSGQIWDDRATVF